MFRLAFIILSLFSCFANSQSKSSICQEHHCLGIVDAGSTGSRLYIYAYDLNEKNNPVQIKKTWSKKIKPGFSTIEPKSMDAYLTDLFATAPSQNIPIYFYATGGMRLLSQPKQQLQYQALQQWFDTQSQWILRDAKTISGKQEGLFGWLALNYKLGSLQSSDKPLASMMDMGGASVQIAIPIEQTDFINPQDLIHINTDNRHVTLFIHSFLGAGQTEVSHQYLNTSSCFPIDYPLPNESMGRGDAFACQQDITKLINSVQDINQIVKPVIINNPETNWYAISGLSTLVKNKAFNFKDNQFTHQSMLEQADNELCQQSWHILKTKYADNDYTYINCLTSSYYYALVVNGYGLQPTQTINYLSDDEEPDWTLGAVLQQYLIENALI